MECRDVRPGPRLDPANVRSARTGPQLVPESRSGLVTTADVIRTGYIDRLRYKHRRPTTAARYRLRTPLAMMHRAEVPEDSILGDTLRERVQDAIAAAGITVGGMPLRP